MKKLFNRFIIDFCAEGFMALRLVIGFFVLTFALSSYGQIIEPGNAPNKSQRKLMDRGYGMFIHFGVNTFSGHEWSDGTTPVEKYNPTRLDCEQWVRVAKDAGFRYVLLVTKHHDGFCLWDSKYTDYDVASSPVKTDVVKAVSDACRKYGLQFGVYYSLWDRHEPSYRDKDPEKYVDYMIAQLRELFTNYGDICELWFDGGWDRPVKDWNLERVYAEVKKMQPDCAVGVNHTIVTSEDSRVFVLPDLMTEDNKYYMQYFPSDFRLWDPKIAHRNDKKQYLHDGKSYYLPFEHTVCISKEWNWFQKNNPKTVRDLDELEELFYWCTYGGNSLVVNVAPDQTGRIRENEANAIISLNRDRLHIKKGKPLPTGGELVSLGAKTEASSVYEGKTSEFGADKAVDGGMQTRWAASENSVDLTVYLDGEKEFNKIVIFEYCDVVNSDDGFSNKRYNRIRSYSIDVWLDGCWETVYISDEPMGDCKVVRFPNKYKSDKVRLRVLDASAPPSIYEFCVFDVAD